MSILESILHVLNDGSLPVWPRMFFAFALGTICGWLAAIKHHHVEKQQKEIDMLREELAKLDFAHPIVNSDGFLVDEENQMLCPRCWKNHMKVRLGGILPICPLCGWDTNKEP